MKRWKRFPEKKPNSGGDLWVTISTKVGKLVTIGIFNNGKFYNSFTGIELNNVTHWKGFYTPSVPKD